MRRERFKFVEPNLTKEELAKMKMRATRQREEVFAILRANLGILNLPMELVDDLI